ncbi:MAG TPA: AMP-binding protein [Stellaceae bacterium]|nr:AMP-binding protein [Stellaceae bacterium]
MVAPLTLFDGADAWSLLASRASAQPRHPWLIWRPFDGPGQTWTYGDFVAEAERVASGLRREGARRGDRILIHMNNCPEMLLTWFACARIGAVAVSTNARLAGEEIAYVRGKVAPVLGVTQPDLVETVSAACPGLKLFVAGGNFDTLRNAVGDAPPERDLTMAPLAIQFTSGTTSRPKGAVFTHANALWGARVGAAHMELTASDVSLVYLPLFHIVGLSWITLATLWAGGTIVLQPRFSASRFWPVSIECGCTFTVMMPFVWKALDKLDKPRHRYRLWNHGALDSALAQRYGVRVNASWGMTEVVTEGTVSIPSLPCAEGGMGRPAPEYQIRVADDDGNQVAPGEIGNLEVRAQRGVGLFLEYYGDPAATVAAFTNDGYFRTGDRVTRLADGSLRYAGRAKDMLKVGGENVAAGEIERVIAAVAGVREAAVTGKPHDFLAEVAVAFVLIEDDVTDRAALIAAIEAACLANLADFKQPREIRIVDELPRSVNEKVAKGVLRKMAAEAGR